MKIGSAWTIKTEENKTFISIALDGVFVSIFPFLKNLNITLSFIEEKDRATERSPHWTVNLSQKKDTEIIQY